MYLENADDVNFVTLKKWISGRLYRYVMKHILLMA